MARITEPQETKRALAFELWKKAPMPMVTLLKTLDVTRLVRLSRRRGWKFHMLMCWCIGKAAAQMEEFYMLPVGDALMQYDRIAVNTIVATDAGGISTCDIPFSESLAVFSRDYLRLTQQVRAGGEAHALDADCMVIGTSALAEYAIDGAVNFYAGGEYNNPFLIWGKYRRKWLKTVLPVSFQFHHIQMDGAEAARFLALLQREIDACGDR